MPMKPIATDTHDFPSLRRDGKTYVDKTMFIHRLVSDADTKLFFMSRPRRFGKSLTVSALKALFSARRELFKGLYIDKTDWEWEKYPIIHFEFNDLTTTSLEEFEASLAYHVKERLRRAGYSYDESIPMPDNFGRAIDTLSVHKDEDGNDVHKGVVILVDEYDAPVGHALGDVAFAEAIRDRLSAVYSQMKNRTGDIRFLFMTGVSKFTRLSVFSALSNLVDVSQRREYATMFGYTEEELTANFEEHLREHAGIMGKNYGEYREEMKRWYNGFRFSPDDATTVYNPVSVALTLDAKSPSGFKATWATTGRPSMLMNYLKREDMLSIDYEGMSGVPAAAFEVADLRNLTATALLFQAGYLTVKGYDADSDDYTIGVPDEEVRRDLATLMAGVAAGETDVWAANLGKTLLHANWPKFFAGLRSLYAHLPYGPGEGDVQEFSYQRVLYTLLASQGVEVVSEDRQSNGRADVVSKHKKGVYIFELKVDEPVDKAFAQIREKKYAEPYLADGRPVWLVGLSFDSKTRHLVDYAAVS
ncbi:MAG: ATP-binding protein, partial [Kiritimatiellae bacterium]|nr:ATP-binding protein [Kiritimatiellia bacterium]